MRGNGSQQFPYGDASRAASRHRPPHPSCSRAGPGPSARGRDAAASCKSHPAPIIAARLAAVTHDRRSGRRSDSLLPGETLPISLASVLEDLCFAGLEAKIKRERVAGFQTSAWGPERRRIPCSVSVYRSSTGARQVLEHSRLRTRAFFAAQGGRSTRVRALGEDARASRLDLGRLKGLTLGWRHGSVLAACSILGRNPPALAELMVVALAQHRRLASTLG